MCEQTFRVFICNYLHRILSRCFTDLALCIISCFDINGSIQLTYCKRKLIETLMSHQGSSWWPCNYLMNLFIVSLANKHKQNIDDQTLLIVWKAISQSPVFYRLCCLYLNVRFVIHKTIVVKQKKNVIRYCILPMNRTKLRLGRKQRTCGQAGQELTRYYTQQWEGGGVTKIYSDASYFSARDVQADYLKTRAVIDRSACTRTSLMTHRSESECPWMSIDCYRSIASVMYVARCRFFSAKLTWYSAAAA